MADPTPTNPYAAAAGTYWQAGWRGILPLPYRRKSPPPDGYTGRNALTPSWPDIQTWIDDDSTLSNIGLRMPDTVLGIDVDAYGDKTGQATIEAAVERWGALPPTWRSTSRDDGVSGIRLYRVPAGLGWPGVLPGGGVELIQSHHRYVVSWPSVHPEGGTYRWVNPAGVVMAQGVANVDDLPALPQSWIDGLSRPDNATDKAEMDAGQVSAHLSGLQRTGVQPCRFLAERTNDMIIAIRGSGSRHDTMAPQMLALLRYADLGHPGIAACLQAARSAFTQAVTADRSRSGQSADNEWGRALDGAVRLIAASPSETQADHDPCDSYTIDPAVENDFWSARLIHQHIQQFARSRRAAPWAVLGSVLARVSSVIEPAVVLPALVGGEGSLNQFVALVGRSGGGKGAAEAAAADAIDLPETKKAGIGSGEGILHQYVKFHPKTKTEPGGIEQHTTRVMFTAAEVDQLGALKGRTGSTLLPMLRDAWSGAQLSFAYVDEIKRVHVGSHAYRLCLTVGVQPGRASVLLDDIDGGTPQRFLWLPTSDPDVPKVAPDSPGRWGSWRMPELPAADLFSGRRPISVCDEAAAAIDAAAVARHRGEVEALDGHALLCRLKAAAALAALDGRLEVAGDDWALSGVLMAVSDATRAGVKEQLSKQLESLNLARGRADGERTVVADEVRDKATQKRVVGVIRRALAGGRQSRAKVRKAVASRDRDGFDTALQALISTGEVVEREAVNDGNPGTILECPK